VSRVQTFLVSGVVLGTVSCEAANRTVAQPLAVCLKAYLCNSKTSEVIFFFIFYFYLYKNCLDTRIEARQKINHLE